MSTPERPQETGARRQRPARGCSSGVLVVLLVVAVAAIVLVLVVGGMFASAAAPILSRSRVAAGQQECLGHLRQIAAAALAYAAANGGVLPDCQQWPQQLSAYGVSADALKCPADKGRSSGSYAMDPQYSGARLSDYPDPYARVLFYDADEQGRAAPRHKGYITCAYMDGHVKTVKGAGSAVDP